jgi:hypothetical protein
VRTARLGFAYKLSGGFVCERTEHENRI